MSNIFLKSDLQEILDNITTAVNDKQTEIPNWLNSVDKNNFDSVTSSIDNNLINQLNVSETSIEANQVGGGSNSNIFSKNNNVNNLIDMLTSDSSENVESNSVTNTEKLESQLKNILAQRGGAKKRSKKKSKKRSKKKSKKRSKKKSKKRSKKQSGGKKKEI